MNTKILVAEDDRLASDLIKVYLERERYWVLLAENGRQALELARQKQPDLIVLDLMLPKVDGLDVCRILRAESRVPIIMLTARTTEEDVLLGLDLGADDYITKPFSPRELVARVRAVLRRIGKEESRESPELRSGELMVNVSSYEVRVSNSPVPLTPTEFRLLEIMMREPGRAFTRLELLERVFGVDYESMERTVDFHVMNLRRKIEPRPEHPTYIQTVYGIGYRFAANAYS